MKYDIFISYRRDGGEYTAKILRDRLEESGYHVFFDVESLRSGDFNTRLYSVIDECRDFLLILSPGALDRCVSEGDWVRREAEYALEKGKNIIPVMLRGFGFPDKLPDTLEPLRYKNGLEANTQLFDAFVGKLRQFLDTKPALPRRIAQNVVFRRTLPLFLALLMLCIVGAGAAFAVNMGGQVYPRTREEKNLTDEALYYISSNLTRMELMADAVEDALEASRQYIYAGASDYSALQSKLALSRQTFRQLDLSPCAPSEGFVARLSESSFPVDDFIAMYDSVENFFQEWTGSLTYVEWLASPDAFLPLEDRLGILERYQVMLDETLRIMAYCTNEMLLPVTDYGALEDFLYESLPELAHIPLSAVTWSHDKQALRGAQEESFTKINNAMMDLSVLLGNYSVENAMMKERLIQGYMEVGFDRSQAEEYVRLLERREELYLQAYEKFSPREGDDVDLLWGKMLSFLSIGLYDGAASCVDAIWLLERENDKYAKEYIPVLYRFIEDMGQGGIGYGVMVVGYYEPDGINEMFRLGDIVIAVEGEPCRNADEYIDRKETLAGNDFTVTVLRADKEGGWERITLELAKDMPRVAIRSLAGDGGDE